MKNLKLIIASLALLFVAASCEPVSLDPPEYPVKQKSILIYMVANNNLTSNATNNINSLLQGYLPTEDNLLVYIHSSSVKPSLLRLYKKEDGSAAIDTVYRFPAMNSADPESLTKVMNVSKAMFPAQEHGLVLWSHGTGWLPEGYYGRTRSFGSDGGNEMDIIDLASALPHKLDFVIFDACLMGGIEVVYQLKDSVDYVIASPTEIMSDGFPYSNIMKHIFRSPMELEAVAKEYYDFYNNKSGSNRSGSIAVVKTSELENVAAKAKEIFEKYGNEGNLNSKLIDTTQIQKYYRGKKHWFYDLNGLMQQLAGEDAKEFTNALNQAVVYKATTPAFLETSINSAKFSGLSTYIPSPRADAELLAYYRKLLWNKDTGYISAE